MTRVSAKSAPPLAHALHDRGLLPMCVVKHGLVAYADPQFAGLFGCKGTLAGTPVGEMAGGRDAERLCAILDAALRDGSRVHLRFRARRTDGSEFEAEASTTRVGGADRATLVMTLAEVSAQQRSVAALHSPAFADELTGLPHRALFLDRLRLTLHQARRHGGPFCIMAADLDCFKELNDSLGHDAGDEVLKAIADRFRKVLRGSDTVARVGGDEFALILPRLGRRDNAALPAGRLMHSIAGPMTAAGALVRIGVSIGIATWPEDGDDLDSLWLQADAATCASKRAGKGRYSFAAAPGEAARVDGGPASTNCQI